MMTLNEFYKTMEGDVIRILLSNDKKYFTTEEYGAGVDRWIYRHYGIIRNVERPPNAVRRKQLMSCELLCEISTDTWALGCLAVNQYE